MRGRGSHRSARRSHPLPGHPASLAATPKRLAPEPDDRFAERRATPRCCRAPRNSGSARSGRWRASVPARGSGDAMRRRISVLTEISFARIFFLLVTRLSLNRPFLVFAQMCVRPRNSNVSGLPVAAPGSILGGVPPELDQPRLLRMQLQTELREPVAQIGQEPLGVLTMLKARHVVVGEPRRGSRPRARGAAATGRPTGQTRSGG